MEKHFAQDLCISSCLGYFLGEAFFVSDLFYFDPCCSITLVFFLPVFV